MCGIVTCIGRLSSDEILSLLLQSENRGMEGTGLIYPDANGVDWIKWGCSPTELINDPETGFDGLLNRLANSDWWIAHTRAATSGQISSRNAHPFEYRCGKRRTVAVHNGIISNWNRFASRRMAVDSQVLVKALSVRDFKRIKKLHGYAAVAGYDSEYGLFTFLSGGSLHACWKDGTLVISSGGISPWSGEGIKRFSLTDDRLARWQTVCPVPEDINDASEVLAELHMCSQWSFTLPSAQQNTDARVSEGRFYGGDDDYGDDSYDPPDGMGDSWWDKFYRKSTSDHDTLLYRRLGVCSICGKVVDGNVWSVARTRATVCEECYPQFRMSL